MLNKILDVVFKRNPYRKYRKVIDNFPKCNFEKGQKVGMTFVLKSTFSPTVDFEHNTVVTPAGTTGVRVTIDSVPVEPNKKNLHEFDEMFKKIKFIEIPIDKIKSGYYDSEVIFAIWRASNDIVKSVRRGSANHYYVAKDGILVWYQGNSAFDSPIQIIGKNAFFIRDDAADYFRFIKFNTSKLNGDLYSFASFRKYKKIS